MSTIYFGIDLGTSSSSISYVVDSPRFAQNVFVEPTTIKFSPSPGASFYHNWQRLPSMVYIEQKGSTQKIFAGFPADEASRGKLTRHFVNHFSSVKSDMGTLKVYEDSVHPEILSPVEVSAEIIKELVRVAHKETGISPKKSHVVITVPASFSHNQRQDVLKAAKLAELTIDDGDLLDEPIAAFIHTACHQKLDAHLDMKTPRKILMFDLGAGTCDISVFEASYSPEFLVSGIGLDIHNKSISNYDRLGGDNIDLHMVEKELLPVFCDKNSIEFYSLPERVKRELRFRLKHKAKQAKEELCRQISQGQATKGMKQQWTIDSFVISAINQKTKKTSDFMKYETFMELMEPFITDNVKSSYKIADDYFTYSLFGPVFSALNKADIVLEDIHGFIFNGGSCHNPVIRRAFETYSDLSNARFFDTPDLDLSVSKGAAIHCYYLHQHKKPIINPIVNNEIGIYTHSLKKIKMIEASTPLPFPDNDEFHINDKFCLPKNNMEQVGISIYSGTGRVVSNMKLRLPGGTRKGDPLSVGLRIDSNKVMTVTAFLNNSPEVKIETELSNPWSHTINTPDDMAANDLWMKVASLKKQRQSISPEMMIDLANRERLRQNTDEAIEILQRLDEKGVDTSSSNNIMALCYTACGDEDKALNYFKKAASLDPKNVTIVTNYGSQLYENGSVEEGISTLKQAVDLDPDHYSPYYWLGFAYRKQGRDDLSEKAFEKSRRILLTQHNQYPDNEQLLSFLADVEQALGNYGEADSLKRELQSIRHSKVFGGKPEDLIAGPDSGIWNQTEIFDGESNE